MAVSGRHRMVEDMLNGLHFFSQSRRRYSVPAGIENCVISPLGADIGTGSQAGMDGKGKANGGFTDIGTTSTTAKNGSMLVSGDVCRIEDSPFRILKVIVAFYVFMCLQKFTSKEIKPEFIQVHGTFIPHNNEVNLLGITIDDNLMFDNKLTFHVKM